MSAVALLLSIFLTACGGDRSAGPADEGTAQPGAGEVIEPTGEEEPPHVEVIIEGVPVGLAPPDLPFDYYPHGLTRDQILSRLREAVPRSGGIAVDEEWSGVIHLTGDIWVQHGVTLTILPGTLVLVAARSDDQAKGEMGQIDGFNPKDPPIDSRQRIELSVAGRLIVRGTREEPVIFTSDAVDARNDDWDGLGLGPDPDAEAEITRAIVEYGRYVSLASPGLVIRQSILRNMMGCVVIGSNICAALERVPLDLTPTITQCYVYNTGRNAITVRTGAPILTHNVIRARPDMYTTGWEQGALAVDVPTCVVAEYNYLDGSSPWLYQGEIYGQYHEYTQPASAGITGVCQVVFRYNTLTGSPLALAAHTGDWIIEYNNLLPVPALLADGTPVPGQNHSVVALAVHRSDPEQGDPCQIEFLEQIGGLSVVDTVRATHNYWGTADTAVIEQVYGLDQTVHALVYEPFETAFIEEAMPDWPQFEW